MMDPNETLRQLRESVAHLRDCLNRELGVDTIDTAAVVVDHVEALDEWLTHGGFPPADWLAFLRRREPDWIWMDTEYVKSITRIRENHDRDNVDLTDETEADRDEILHIHKGEVGIRFVDEQSRMFILAGNVDGVLRATKLAEGLARRAWIEAQESVTIEPLGPPDPAGVELPEHDHG